MKKVFTLLTLALMSIGSAWGQTTLLSYETGATAPTAKTDIEAGKGTIQAGSAFTPDGTVSGKYGWKLDGDPATAKSSSKYVMATLADGVTFQEGDIISISGYSTSSASTDSPQGFSIYDSAGGSDYVQYGHVVSISATKKTLFTADFTVESGSKLIGESSVYILRYWPSGEKGVSSYFQGVTITRPATDTASPTCSTTQTKEEAKSGTPLELTVTADHFDELQWYKATKSDLSDAAAISGATAPVYSFTAAKEDIGKTYYFYCIATNSKATGTKTAQSSTITVNVVASTACQLYQVVYSNSFDAFINEPVKEAYYTAEDEDVKNGKANVGDLKSKAKNGTVKAYYLEGTSEPTITSYKKSEGATVSTATAGKIIVTAEDGTTTATYDITVEAVTPFGGTSKVFDGKETWVKTGNAFSTDEKKTGWVFSKNDNDWSRETPGKNRIYFFLAASTSITFANGGTARNIKVYRNGVELVTPTSTESCTIEGDASNDYMIAIVSNQTSGDGALKSITIVGATKETITPAKEYTTLTSANALDFTGSSIEAYIVKDDDASDGVITLTQVNKVPANTGLVLKASEPGTAVNVPFLKGDADDVTGNKMTGSATEKTEITANGGYILKDGKFHPANAGSLAKGKAYLKIAVSVAAPVMSFDSEGSSTTAIDTIEKSTIKNGVYYNLAGQRVAQPTKGLYIVNGKKVIVK